MPKANSEKKIIQTSTARRLAMLFLIVMVALGIFDAPTYALRIFRKVEVAEIPLRTIASRFPYRSGLDIQGGTHLVYQADLKNIPSGEQGDSMDSVRNVIERRVNLFGVAEPLVQVEKSGEDRRLIVDLAGVADINAAIQLIGQTPFLEFREERSPEEKDAILKDQKNGGLRATEDPYFKPTPLTGRYLKKAQVQFDRTSLNPQIGLELTDEGAKIFEDITKRNIGKQLAIYLDGAPISAPVVRQEISGGRAQITGNFTPQQAKELVERLNAGALPVPIRLVAQQSVQATLGQESLARSLHAGLIGFVALALFMILWYRMPGILSVFALLLYIGIVLALFKLIPVTLTIAGIAGLVLSIGMAVDANILIFERMKEELRSGKALEDAIREGFGRAWTSIRDSNVSSLITSVILFWLGSSVVKGFALTLSIGILVSMFSAISVTRTLLIAVLTPRLHKKHFFFLSGFAGE